MANGTSVMMVKGASRGLGPNLETGMRMGVLGATTVLDRHGH